HPTQTLLDLFSIKKTQNKIDNLHVAMAGDLKYGRTVHSLASALAKYNCTLYFISPDSLNMPDYIKEELKKNKIKFSEHKEIQEVIDKLDILYMTRIQAERFPDKTDYEKVRGVYVLDKSMLNDVKDSFRIMHPLPRVDEIATEVDSTPYAYYFEQAANGVPVRQALLGLLTGGLK
ncbi:MAG: aspartate carbamoyltransferase, partial [Candidatus Muiribacteriota bacterium]